MFFFRKRQKGTNSLDENEKKAELYFDEQSIKFGKDVIDHSMIIETSQRLIENYKRIIEKDISITNRNECKSWGKFTVSPLGIMHPKGYGDKTEIDVCIYKEYNVSIVEEAYKRKGIAWALQAIIIPVILEKYPQIESWNVEVGKENEERVETTIYFNIKLNNFQQL